jgi:hypothetical protein
LRVSPGGTAILAWQTVRARVQHIAAAIGDTRHGFGRPAVLSGQATTVRFDAAAGPDGTRAVVWRGGRLKGHTRVQVARVGPGAEAITSRDTRTISRRRAADVALAIGDRGDVTVAWSRYLKYPGPTAVEVATAPRSGHFGKPQLVSSAGPGYGAHPQVAVNSDGDRFLAWIEGSPKHPAGLGGAETAHWAMAPAASRRFAKPRKMASTTGIGEVRLYRGALGAMLAAVRQESAGGGSSWSLLTYRER